MHKRSNFFEIRDDGLFSIGLVLQIQFVCTLAVDLEGFLACDGIRPDHGIDTDLVGAP